MEIDIELRSIAREIELDWDPTRIPARCWGCNQRQTILVKLTDNGRTRNHIGVCTNEPCFRYTEIRKLETWVRATML